MAASHSLCRSCRGARRPLAIDPDRDFPLVGRAGSKSKNLQENVTLVPRACRDATACSNLVCRQKVTRTEFWKDKHDVDFRRAFTYMVDDPRWLRKLGMGGVIALVPVLGTLALWAYQLKAIRNVADKYDTRLSEWRDPRAMLLSGLKCVCLIIAIACPLGVLILLLWLVTGSFPHDISGPEPFIIRAPREPSATLIFFVMTVVVAVFTARFAITGSLMESRHLGVVVMLLRADPASWALAVLVGYGIAAAQDIMFWAWFTDMPRLTRYAINALVTATTAPYIYLVHAHLVGQAHRRAARTAAIRTASNRF